MVSEVSSVLHKSLVGLNQLIGSAIASDLRSRPIGYVTDSVRVETQNTDTPRCRYLADLRLLRTWDFDTDYLTHSASL
jgi:hypothetical protein